MKIPFAFIIGWTFVILKLTHVISWSWWWVTLPFTIWAILVFAFAFVREFE